MKYLVPMMLASAVVLLPMQCILVTKLRRDSAARTVSQRIRQNSGAPVDAGNRVVAALRDYHRVAGKYPGDLQSLVPAYLPDIPAPGWGLDHWSYWSDNMHFFLSVKWTESDYMVAWFDSRSPNGWYLDH